MQGAVMPKVVLESAVAGLWLRIGFIIDDFENLLGEGRVMPGKAVRLLDRLGNDELQRVEDSPAANDRIWLGGCAVRRASSVLRDNPVAQRVQEARRFIDEEQGFLGDPARSGFVVVAMALRRVQ